LFELERAQGGEAAVLVHLFTNDQQQQEDLNEFQNLVRSAGITILDLVVGFLRHPDAKYLLPSGKVLEVGEVIQRREAKLAIVNHRLTPSQERNLEKAWQCRVADRNTLILDIFAQRARSFEGKLQVEWAQLKHLSTRLVRGWTHLERQRGGLGLRGPGEKQLEIDRRLIKDRIAELAKRLEKVDNQRTQMRHWRQRSQVPVVALVGYTNAGKSTLFNALTHSDAYAADKLFATLDPTVRRLSLPFGKTLLLADTVGFIRHLPHDLIAAFRATLQEAAEADLLLHVIDAASAERQWQMEQVQAVLELIGAEKIPQWFIFNKIDQLPDAKEKIVSDNEHQEVWLSAKSGAGLALLKTALSDFFSGQRLYYQLFLPFAAGDVRAKLFAEQAIVEERLAEAGWQLLLYLPEAHLRAWQDQWPLLKTARPLSRGDAHKAQFIVNEGLASQRQAP
jgi:GTP-binding protein HflX